MPSQLPATRVASSESGGYAIAPESTHAKLMVRVLSPDRKCPDRLRTPLADDADKGTNRGWKGDRSACVKYGCVSRECELEIMLSKLLEYIRRFNAQAQPRQGSGRVRLSS
jgi:hypothetical protein